MKPTNNHQLSARRLSLSFLLIFFFSLSSYAQPSNNDCSGATNLTSSTSCNNNQYRLRNATASSGIPVGCAAGGTHYDVWFRFTAVSTSHTVTISSLQSNFTNPEIQLYSYGGNCASLTSIICGTTTMTGTGLTIGNTYYIRVSNIGSSISSNDRFEICVTHPNPPPSNDNCSGATTLTSGYSCNATTGNMRYSTSNGPAGACGGTLTTTYDVWYRFQAVSATQVVTVGGLGSNMTTATTYMEVLSGACGTLTSIACQTVSTTNGRRTLTGLTVGNFYYVRVYVLTNPTASSTSNWNFSICVQHPPANDNCTGATILTSGVTCSNVASSLDVATASPAPPGCFGATYWDVWFQYIATAVSQTITLSNLGTNVTTANIRIQEYSGTCGVLVPLGLCATGITFTQAGHVIGTTYYVRVALINPAGTNPSTVNSTTNNFNICVTSVAAPPSNDACANAISLNSNTTCNSISGTLINATATGGLPACGNAASPEVWYSFVAESEYPAITLGSIGANLLTAGPRIQLFSGACGGLTQLICQTVFASPVTLNTGSIPGGAPLTIGATYYIRITTQNLLGPVATGTYTFDICVTDAAAPPTAYIDYSKSYVNITDGTVGGTIDPGDILEIRATLVVKNLTGPTVLRAIDSVGFYDTINSANGLAYVDSLCLRTNEGKNYKWFTDAADGDAGWTTTSGPNRYFQINMGLGATASRYARGKLRGSSRPSFFNNTCIILATYRVQVTAGYGTKIGYGGGAFRFRDTMTGIFYTVQFPYDSLMVFESPGSCQNSVSQSNILGDEFNGTFGEVSGSPVFPQNRNASANTTYTFTNFAGSTPQDYQYGIANNTSAAGSTNQSLGKPGGATRVHGVWDISGDHTNASNTAVGNLPCNLGAAKSPANPCGYMLVVNASYRTDVAFQFNVSGACPNTYYEISAWLKNVCARCGCDSLGRGAGVSVPPYIPISPGDSSGVRPNIAVEINGVDYYTTGDLVYQGVGAQQGPNLSATDAANRWVQRAFVYKTGPSETNFTMTLRNNAPGGGGNDWAIDDIALKTCTPTMNYSPSYSPTVCENNQVTIYDTVRCYYDTYVEYKWQYSTDGGASWADIGSAGTGTPIWNGTQWEYVASYTIPPAYTTAANDGDMYRLVVATSTANLSSATCNFTDVVNISLDVLIGCGPPLKTDLISIAGKLNDDKAKITWVTTKEEEPVDFQLQRSDDGNSFHTIATVNGYNNINTENNTYSHDDPTSVTTKVYYRVIMFTNSGTKKYSRIIQLSPGTKDFGLGIVVNPFSSELQYEIVTPQTGIATTELIDQYGITVRRQTQRIDGGVNALKISSTEKLPAGIYTLKVSMNGSFVVRRVVKGTY